MAKPRTLEETVRLVIAELRSRGLIWEHDDHWHMHGLDATCEDKPTLEDFADRIRFDLREFATLTHEEQDAHIRDEIRRLWKDVEKN
jgi:hypothetical protein